MTSPQCLQIGVDVGGSAVKGAIVDIATGRLVGARTQIATPNPSTPTAVANAVARIVENLASRPIADSDVGVGVAVPAVVTGGTVRTAANIDLSWIGTDGQQLLSARLGCRVRLVNDADAAGIAESRFGAARSASGLVFVATLGTGIGSALMHAGVLIPGSELGHLELDGDDAERRAAASAKSREGLTWTQWAARVDHYLQYIERLLWPDLFVVGGAISSEASHFIPLLHLRAPVVPAHFGNDAGIVGAAVLSNEPAEAMGRVG